MPSNLSWLETATLGRERTNVNHYSRKILGRHVGLLGSYVLFFLWWKHKSRQTKPNLASSVTSALPPNESNPSPSGEWAHPQMNFTKSLLTSPDDGEYWGLIGGGGYVDFYVASVPHRRIRCKFLTQQYGWWAGVIWHTSYTLHCF